MALALPASAGADPVPLSSVGSAGSGAGQLQGPGGVAIDGFGNVYVADSGNSRIDEFAANGTFIRAFGWDVADPNGNAAFEVCPTQGACRDGDPGDGAGQLSTPGGIALDGAGNLYVGDSGNSRIDVFSTAGPSFTRAFGWDVAPGGTTNFEVCTSTCQMGSPGDGAGQLNGPSGVAVDGGGNLYVADTVNNRISVFNTAGPSFTRAFGSGVAGGFGFEVCTSSCQMGNPGGGAGELGLPLGVALDGAGSTLYVSEAVNPRVSVFGTAGPSFTRAFGWGVGTGASAFEVCTAVPGCGGGNSGPGAGQLDGATGLALDGASNLYVADANNNRISAFGTAGPSFTRAFGWGVDTGASAFEVCTTGSGCQAGSGGSGVGQLNSPLFVATDCRGAVWVGDSTNNRVQRFGEAGTALPPCTSGGGGGGGAPPPTASGPTGQRAAALAKCKKKKTATLRKKCKRKAKLLPV